MASENFQLGITLESRAVDALSSTVTLFVLRARQDQEELSYMLRSEQDAFLARLLVVLKNHLIVEKGVAPSVAIPLVQAYLKALTWRTVNRPATITRED